VRGAGFIWSPLLRRSGYTSHHLVHITDWLPTLMHAVSTESDSFHLPQNLDGLDQWDALSENLDSQRNEILHNIDPGSNAAALRIGDMKLVSASRGSTRKCAGWYPTDELQRYPCKDGTPVNADFLLDNSKFAGDVSAPGQGLYKSGTVRNLNATIVRDAYQPDTFHFIIHDRPKFHNDGTVRPPYLSEVAHPQHSELSSLLEKIGRKPFYRQEPLVVKCGPRPGNASSNCKPWESACLYNVTADPCEYENLASSRTQVVEAMQQRLQFYKEHSARPLNCPIDDAGLPYHHDWNWVPWRKAASQTGDGK